MVMHVPVMLEVVDSHEARYLGKKPINFCCYKFHNAEVIFHM
jgi:hypothetical protein